MNVDQGGQNRTGFSESVELGDIGTIMESNERVLAFEIRNLKADRRATVDEYCNALQMDEVRFRGNAFACYKEGRWTRDLWSTVFRQKATGGQETWSSVLPNIVWKLFRILLSQRLYLRLGQRLAYVARA